METRLSQNSLSQLLRVTVVLLVVVLGASALLWQTRLLTGLDAEKENSRTETIPLYGLRRVRQQAALYRDPSKPPYATIQYMPLFFLIPGTAARWTGAGEQQTVLIGRAYVYGCWLGIGLLIFIGTRQEGLKLCYCLLAAGLWLAGNLAWRWAYSYRPDAPALFFGLAGILIFMRKHRSPSLIILGTIFLVVGFLHKQSMVAAPLVVVGWEMLAKRYKSAFVISVIWWGLVVASLAMTQVLSGGMFFMNVFTSLSRTESWFAPIYLLTALLAGIPIFAGAFMVVFLFRKQLINKLLCLYFMTAFGVGLVSSFKAGANVNYYLEAYAIGCLLVGGLCSTWAESAGSRLQGWVAVAWYALAIGWALETLLLRINDRPTWQRVLTEHQQLQQAEAEDWTRILERLDQEKGALLIEDDYLAYRRGSEPYLVDVRNIGGLIGDGRFDDREILERIVRGGFAAIVTTELLDAKVHFRPFTDHWIETIQQYYRLAEIIPAKSLDLTVYIYRPRIDKSGRN